MITNTSMNVDTEVYIANTIPQNIEAELSVLGGILLDPNAIHLVIDILPVEAFSVKAHRTLYRACLKLCKQQESVDLLTVTTYLADKNKLDEVGGQIALVRLLDSTVSTVNIDRYAALIVDKYRRRRIMELCYEGLKNVGEPIDTKELIEDFYERITELNCSIGSRKTGNTEDHAYENLIKKFADIEMNTLDPGKRSYRLGNLAKKAGMSRRDLESLYYQHLIGKENEPVRYLSELRKECEDTSNEWYLQGFIPKGTVMLLHAAGGLGKSRISYEFAYHLASGTPWGQFHVTAPQRKVMLIQTDEQKNDTMRAIADRWPADRADQFICHKSRWSMAHLSTLRHEIEAHGVEVVIIDSLTSVNKHSLFSENETEYARPILLLKEMAEELGVTFVIIHHSNKEGKSRGTQAIFNSVSLVLSLQLPNEGSDRGSPNRILAIEKSRFHRPSKYKLRYEIDEETHQWQWICEGEDARGVDLTLPVKEKILDFLHVNRNQRWKSVEIYSAIGGSIGDVRKACYHLANDGLIERKPSQAQGRAWLYCLPWEDGLVSDRESTIANSIANSIANANPDEQKNSSVTDRDFENSEKNFEKKSTGENRKNTIANLDLKAQTTQEQDIQDPKVTDRISDRVSDRSRSLNDRPEKVSDRSQEINAQTPSEKDSQVSDRELPKVSDRRSQNVDRDREKDSQVSDRYPFKIGDRVINVLNNINGPIVKFEGEETVYYSEYWGEVRCRTELLRPDRGQTYWDKKQKPKGFGKPKDK